MFMSFQALRRGKSARAILAHKRHVRVSSMAGFAHTSGEGNARRRLARQASYEASGEGFKSNEKRKGEERVLGRDP